VTTRTPPPVVVDDESNDPSLTPGRRARIGLGALALALAVSSGGAVATAVTSTSEQPTAAAAPAIGQLTESCAASVAVSGIPAGARALVRESGERSARAPTRVQGDEALFTGLRCREPVEVTVASGGGQSWVRIPVSADTLTPAPELPSEVRVAVSVR
jgi:hypothetical protein